MRIAHVADTHLGYRQYNLDEREEDIYDAFNQVVERVIEERADVVIHSGDLFDSYNPPIRALHVFKEALKRLSGRARVVAVLGDHDTPRRRGPPPHDLFDDLIVFKSEQLQGIEVNGVLIAGISNQKGRRAGRLKEELSRFDAMARGFRRSVLVAHQAIKRYLPFEEAFELTEGDLPRRATYYALGHIHSRVLERFGEGYLAYAGSIEIMGRDEVSQWSSKGKGFYIVDLDGDEPEVHEVNVDVRPQYEVLIDLARDSVEGALSKYLRQSYAKLPVFHVVVSGAEVNRRQVIDKVKAVLEGRALRYSVSFRDPQRPGSVAPEFLTERGFTNLGAMIKEYLERRGLNDQRDVDLAMTLLELLSEGEIEGAKRIVENLLRGEGQ